MSMEADTFTLTNAVYCWASHSKLVQLLFHVTDQSEGQYLSKLPSSLVSLCERQKVGLAKWHFIVAQLKSDPSY